VLGGHPWHGQSGRSPNSGNTAERVSLIERSSHESGSKPSEKSRYTGSEPSVIASGAGTPTRSATWSRQLAGVDDAGSSGVPPRMASRWVQERGTTSATATPPSWRDEVAERLGVPAPEAMTDGSEPTYRDFSEGFDPDSWLDRAITETRASVFPEHGIDPMSW